MPPTQCTQYMCPGDFSVWVNTTEPTEPITTLALANFNRIPEVLSWQLEAEADDPESFRTADSGGLKVKSNCAVGIEWTLTVNTKLCIGNWLYNCLLKPAASSQYAPWYSGSQTQPAWWFLSWDPLVNAQGSGSLATALGGTAPGASNDGIYIFGTPTPPSIGGDNNSDETAGAEFTVNVTTGPYFPIGMTSQCTP